MRRLEGTLWRLESIVRRLVAFTFLACAGALAARAVIDAQPTWVGIGVAPLMMLAGTTWRHLTDKALRTPASGGKERDERESRRLDLTNALAASRSQTASKSQPERHEIRRQCRLVLTSRQDSSTGNSPCYIVDRVHKVLSADRTHQRLESVCLQGCSEHFTRAQVVASIGAGHSLCRQRIKATGPSARGQPHAHQLTVGPEVSGTPLASSCSTSTGRTLIMPPTKKAIDSATKNSPLHTATT